MSKKPKLTGPASYFPSIEKKYGQPIKHWLKLLKGLKDMKHMEMVNWLKTEHGMGHGHANALVAYLRANPQNSAAIVFTCVDSIYIVRGPSYAALARD